MTFSPSTKIQIFRFSYELLHIKTEEFFFAKPLINDSLLLLLDLGFLPVSWDLLNGQINVTSVFDHHWQWQESLHHLIRCDRNPCPKPVDNCCK